MLLFFDPSANEELYITKTKRNHNTFEANMADFFSQKLGSENS